MKAGHLEFNTNKKCYNFVKGHKGVPGILSPLLSNLMLHELDKYIMQLIKERASENKDAKPSLRNGVYGSLSYSISCTQRKLMNVKDDLGLKHFDLGMKKEKRRLIRKRCKVGSTIPNPNYIKMDYVRYADDWLIGLWGPRRYASQVKEKIRVFLEKIGLELSEKKTLITSTITGKAKFLGTYISTISAK